MEWPFIIMKYLNMAFWRFLINHSMFVIFNDTGRTAFKFGRFEYFFVFLLPVFQEISIKNQSRDTWRCCCNTVGCLYGTLNTWSVFFNIMMWYSNIVKWHSHIPAFPQLSEDILISSDILGFLNKQNILGYLDILGYPLTSSDILGYPEEPDILGYRRIS